MFTEKKRKRKKLHDFIFNRLDVSGAENDVRGGGGGADSKGVKTKERERERMKWEQTEVGFMCSV